MRLSFCLKNMLIFVELKKLKLSGMESHQTFNRINLSALILFAYCFCETIAFLPFESISFVHFGNSFFGAASFLLNSFTLSSYVFKQEKSYNLFG